ncbi:MAG: hypothetical protein ACREXG_08665 [Polaromonas sp.]
MGIVSFSHSSMLSALLAPVQALATWFVPAQSASGQFAVPAGARRAPHQPHQLVLPFAHGGTTVRRRPATAHTTAAKSGSRMPSLSRLKVVRELDSAVSPACAGRMVISGRMADVCAELERMAQREAAMR